MNLSGMHALHMQFVYYVRTYIPACCCALCVYITSGQYNIEYRDTHIVQTYGAMIGRNQRSSSDSILKKHTL